MSSSAIIAAKKRLEAYLKKYEIPTVESVDDTTTDKSGVLLLSLLQSRLSWTSSVFPKYKADPVQQPKRASSSRKKWPNMKYLGTGNLELGPHLFEQTTFYEATRTISWKSIAKIQGLDVPEDTVMTEATTEEQKPATAEEEVKKEQQVDESELLKFVDIVFELNEVPNERFVFPKESLISFSVEDGHMVLHASFLLPIDTTDYFFESPKSQILKFGRDCQLPYIQEFFQFNNADNDENTDTTCHPTNIRITEVGQVTIDAIEDAVHKSDDVKESMSIKMKSVPEIKKFVKYDLSEDPENNAEVQNLLKRSLTVPEITLGPIMAEKKRNEILNSIKLGKRPRDEKFEAELPKNKYLNANAKDDGLLKCAYCGTKHTSMWRPGPAGHGTLCNSCGYQWKRGEILKGAPIISLQEERQLIKEKKEKERIAEALELEKADRENKKGASPAKKNVAADVVDLSSKKFAAQLLSSRSKQNKSVAAAAKIISNNSNPASRKTSPDPAPALTTETATPEKKKNTTKSSKAKSTAANVDPAQATPANEVKPVQIAAASNPATKQEQPQTQAQPSATQQQPQTQSQQQQQPIQNPFMLYSQGGIPLPTLFIDFVGSTKYAHPNCAVTLLDTHFHIRLCSPEGELCLINLEKTDLAAAQFDISQEGGRAGDTSSPVAAVGIRELLTMTIPAIPNKPIDIFTKTFNNSPITIRFLEKLDPTGGAVVKRILQRWLVTVLQPS